MKLFVVLACAAILLYGLGSSLLPLILATVGAILSQPFIDWLKAKGIKKPFSTILIIMGVFIPILLLNFILVPMFFRELKDFLEVLPQNMTTFLDQVESLAIKVGLSLDYSRADLIELVNVHAKEVSVSLLKIITDALKRSAGNVTEMILTILNIFLIPVFFFYLVSENQYWRSLLKAIVPRAHHENVMKTFKNSVQLLKSYLQGQFIACTVLAVLYAIGLFAAGLKFGILIGIITGALSFIPYVGFSLGLIAGIVVAFSMGQGLGYVGLVFAIFFVIQAIESFVVTPKLVGNTVGLTPLESILVLIIFGNLFGFAGMIIAIPTGAILKSIIAEYV